MNSPARSHGLSTEPVLQLVGLDKSYGHVHALRGVTLDVSKGQFVTLLGPSGSGKTTLLHVVAGFTRPDRGSVISDGVDITQVPAHERGLGVVFQHYALFPHMSVWDNIAYALRVRGSSRTQLEAVVGEFVDLVEMRAFVDRFPDALSGGERQRVALARALVFGPSVLLLDEALSALDRRLRQSLQFTIKKIQRELGATFIHVTHDQDEALAMSDVIVLMRHGSVEQIGTPNDLYSNPASPFVSAFMGETNQLSVTVLDSMGPRTHLLHAESKQAFDVITRGDLPTGPASGAPGLLCVRPENVRFVAPGEGGSLSGRVVSRTFMGDHWRYEVEIAKSTLIVKEAAHSNSGRYGEGQIGITFEDVPLPLFTGPHHEAISMRDVDDD